MFKLASIMVLLSQVTFANEWIPPVRMSSARPDELAISITKTRLEYVQELVREFKATCGVFPTSLDSLFEPDKDACEQFPRLTTAYTLLDGWDRPFHFVARGQSAYAISYGADNKEGGHGANADIALQI